MVQTTEPITRPFNAFFIPVRGTYRLDPAHTFIYFAAQHLVVGRVRGRFNSFSGTITVEEDPLRSSVDISIDTDSINTQNNVRDEDLRSPHFLDVKAFPTMTYRGVGVTFEFGGHWTLEGELTVRDITQSVPLVGTFRGAIIDPSGNTRVAFLAATAITRRDYGLTWDLDRETGGLIVAKDVVIDISAEAVLKP